MRKTARPASAAKGKGLKKSPKESVRQKVLLAVLAQVPFDGWTNEGFARGLEQAGVSRGEGELLFPSGLRDVIDLFGAMADDALQQRVNAEPGYERMRVRDKIAFGARARLEALTPYREAWRRLMWWYAMPLHAPLGAKRLYKTVDLIWRAAGDTSTDFNFYTKRGLLAGVLKTTTLFWLDDQSPGCAESWKFLDRRIGEVLKVGKTISLAKEWKPAEIFEMLRTKLRRT